MIIKNTVNSLSKAKQSKAKQSKAKQSKAKQSKAKQTFKLFSTLCLFNKYYILFSKKYFKSIFNIIKRKINFFLFSKYFYINNLLFKEIKL